MATGSRSSDKDPQASSWSFEDGVLSVHHRGATISLGRYATLEHAARAAEKYIAQHSADKEPG